MTQITFIGGGNMAEALIKGILDSGEVDPGSVTVSDIREERLAELREAYGVKTETDNEKAVEHADEVWLCVKPQQILDVIPEVHASAPPEAVFISIAAGVETEALEKVTGVNARIVRVMPNTAALVREGAAGVAGGSLATEEDLQTVMSRMRCVGRAVKVDEEDLHAVTALSGSGPAYVFYLVEAMLRGAEDLGLDPEQARELAVQTVVGAGKLLQETGLSAGELLQRVTSKGGTTAAALAAFEEADVGEGLMNGVLAAASRSVILARDES